MVKVYPLSQVGSVAEALEVQQVFPRVEYIVPIADADKWFSGVHCVNPENGKPCDLMKVRWVGRNIASWAKVIQYGGRLCITTLNWDLIAQLNFQE